jgi:hypothetical protein
MSLPVPINLQSGQIALDPINGVVYYKDEENNLVATTWSWLRNNESSISTDDNVLIDSDLTISGNLVVEGDTVSLNVAELLIEDNILILNANFVGSPILNAGIEVERGDEPNTSIRWNEDVNSWQFTNDGINYFEVNSIIEDSVTLGFHTVGDYVKNLTAGTGVTILSGSGEGTTPTISIGQDVSVGATPTFSRVLTNLTGDVTGDLTGNVTGDVSGNLTGDVSGNVTGDLTGDVTGDLTGNVTGDVTGNVTGDLTGDVTGDVTGDLTGNVTGDVTGDLTGNVTGQVSDISNHGITDLDDVVIVEPSGGDFLRYDGPSQKWINDPVNLTTDTVGDYVSTVISGTGISVINSGGEGSTPNVSLNANLNNLNDVVISGATPGQILSYDGENWVNTVSPTMEPIGFENKADSTISFNKATREFSIAPSSTSYSVWCVGKKFTKTSTETIQIPNNSTLHYIFFDSEGRLGTRESYFNWDSEAPVSYVYWNAVDQEAYFFADERHGIVLDWATHEYLHRTRGAAIANGFGANNYVTNGDGSLDSHAQIDIANGTFFDEDLQVDIFHSATPTPNTWEQVLQGNAEIPVFYRSNTHWVKDTATTFPLKAVSSIPQYNLDTAGTWSSAPLGNNQWGISWLIATNNLNEPIIAILGQNTYASKEAAEASFYGELDLSAFPIVEFRPLYKVVYEYKSSYSNAVKARFVGVYDLRSIISADQGISSTAVSDHGSMTGLADDDHPQYLLANGSRTASSLEVSGTVTANQVTINSLVLDGIEIDAATPSDTNVLKYSSALNKYIPGVASTVASLDDLTDVIISSATPEQILVYQEDGTWINSFVPIPSVEGTAFFQTLGDGVQEVFTVNHQLGTRDIFVSTRDANAPYASFITTWEAIDSNNINLIFDNPPDSGSVRVSIYAALAGSSFPDLEGTTFVGRFGDGEATVIPVIHDLGTRNVFIQVRNAESPYELLNVAWESTSTNITTFYFDSAPDEDSIQILIYSSVIGVPTTSLSGLTDVNYVDPDDRDILSWDEASSRWIPQAFLTSVSLSLYGLNDISDVEAESATPGEYLKFDGEVWVNDTIDLGTDTNGSYVKNLVAGTGINITNNSGEGATPNIEVSSIVVKTTDTAVVTETMLATGVARSGFRSTLNAQTGTSYTLVLTDLAKLVTLSNTSAITLTIPLESSVAFLIGDRIDILQTNTGQVTIVGAAGVTVNATPGLKLRSRWSSATLVKLDTNSWVIIGDMQA